MLLSEFLRENWGIQAFLIRHISCVKVSPGNLQINEQCVTIIE
jgi:hypothetical protein